jgi:Flp pilus assembly protein TadB
MQPTWTVLAVAFVGVAGTLGAAVFTQIWSARREDRRWRQEQAAEGQRWERQQQERRDQWKRDDQLRRVAQRQEAHTQFLLAVASWASAAYALIVAGGEPPRALDSEDLSRLGALVEQAEAARVPLRLHGSEEVSATSEEVCRVMTSAVRAFADGSLTGEQVDQVLLDFRRTSQAALAQARADLDIA